MLEIKNVEVYDLKECVIASGNSMRTSPVEYTEEEFEKGLARCRKLVRFGGGSGQTNFRTGIRVSFDMKYTQYITKQFQRYHWFDYVNSSSLMHRIAKMDFKTCHNGRVPKPIESLMNTFIEMYNLMCLNKDNESFCDIVKDYQALTDYYYGEGYFVYNGVPADALYDCYMNIISACPMGTELFARISTNYEQLATICKQREGHRLKEDYGAFFDFVKTLPYADDFILCDMKGGEK